MLSRRRSDAVVAFEAGSSSDSSAEKALATKRFSILVLSLLVKPSHPPSPSFFFFFLKSSSSSSSSGFRYGVVTAKQWLRKGKRFTYVYDVAMKQNDGDLARKLQRMLRRQSQWWWQRLFSSSSSSGRFGGRGGDDDDAAEDDHENGGGKRRRKKDNTGVSSEDDDADSDDEEPGSLRLNAAEVTTLRAGEKKEAIPTECKIPLLIQRGNGVGKQHFEAREYTYATIGQELRKAREAWKREAEGFVRSAIEEKKVCKGIPDYAVCISASYYAAEFARCRRHPATVKAGEARRTFCRAFRELLAQVEAVASAHPRQDETVSLADVLAQVGESYEHTDPARYRTLYEHRDGATVLSNLTYQTVLFKLLFSDDTDLRICRDWNFARPLIDDSQSSSSSSKPGRFKLHFRTTWSSGWYLNYLRHRPDVDIPELAI